MSDISAAFAQAQSENRAALVLYVTAGHPTLEASFEAAVAAAVHADILEIGIPFSDPVADGPVIQNSTQIAIENKTRLGDCLQLAANVRAAASTPLVFLTYYNPVLRRGLDTFAQAAAEAGVDGIICPDLPSEEAGPLYDALAPRAIDFIPMVAPTSTDDRLQSACALGSGFVYCVSRTGVTGMRESLNEGLEPFLKRVRACTALPRAVGFGVSTAVQAREVAKVAEGVIIGSALVKLIDGAPPELIADRIRDFSADIREGMNGRG